ncbi:hypothetical protein CYMTET_17549 [Cymbomonas tetramitiformis]|uniref:Uncharacterized protein n=1 Tax=Cymbomonas tetramitiformis TaxID=36881 RepID=A0AAE0L767_9CHLO|nr:hypothetical protein CYMTET_17549 [Cymbomonas tetramitiformis]
MVLPTDTYELYVEFVVHLPDKGDVYPVERILSHHMSMVDELVSAEQLRTGTAAKTMEMLEHNLQIHKAYLRHANTEKMYPERLTARKLAGLKLEPAEDVRGCQKEEEHDSEVDEGNAADDVANDAAVEAVKDPAAANDGEAVENEERGEDDEKEEEEEEEEKEEEKKDGKKDEKDEGGSAPKKASPLQFQKRKKVAPGCEKPAKKSKS